MSPLTVLLLILVVAAVAVYRYAGSTPTNHRVPSEKLQFVVSQLLRRGYNGGIAVIRDPAEKRFIRLSKYFKTDGTMGLDLAVPTMSCTPEERERFEAWARIRHIDLWPFASSAGPVVAYPSNFYTYRRARAVNGARMVGFHCGPDVTVARDMVESIFSEVFGFGTGGDYLVEFWGINLHDELVDMP